MKKLLYVCLLGGLSACQTPKKDNLQTASFDPLAAQNIRNNSVKTPEANANTVLIFNPPHGQAGHNCAIAVGAPLNRSAAKPQPNPAVAQTQLPTVIASNTDAKKLNPEHGQPNHRCDIAVGAPLDSKPVQTAVKQLPATKTQVAYVQTGKNINPAHGQPNHRCDIAVGAPLDSKPVQVASKPAASTTPELKSNTENAEVKLNPKHGETGHRCDIAVGAPLS